MQLKPVALGSTDISVSRIGLGTVKIGRNTGVKYPAAFELPDDEAVLRLLAAARDSGINLVDTAPAYGTSEARLGELMSAALRHEWIICTKVGESYIQGESVFDFSRSAITQSIDNSLRLLRTDYLDIVLIHSDGNDLDILNRSDAMETLVSLQSTGKIRAIGMSTKTVAGGLQALEHSDVIMLTYNLEDRSQFQLIERANELNKGVLIKKALASGHADAASSLRFVLAEPAVHAAVLGTINTRHLQQNIDIAIDLEN